MSKPIRNTEIKKILQEIRNNLKEQNKLSHNICVILQDIQNPINVGHFFRISDAFKVDKIFLTGSTPKPPNKDISISSMGFERSVTWEYYKYFDECLYKIKDNFLTVGVEITKNSKNYWDFDYKNKNIALIFGNEQRGIYKKNLKNIKNYIHIPMLGKGLSLNVAVSCAIVLGHIRFISRIDRYM